MSRHTINFTLNGRPVTADVGTHQNLTEVLQESFGLFGARESCGQGLCGCCTVLIDGAAVTSCLSLAAFADGSDVQTVEGLADGEELSPEQEAFIETGAFQCGYCTPGFVLMTKQLLDENPNPDDDEIKHYLSGNLCRCGAYPEIVQAVRLAGEKRRAR
ncbi:MAG: (2Fe-2S)-binding protein [Rhodospirillaceae bacterium]|nr:(2Fe-2S)-binding protein [Rhodospirillaceae bacterium]MDD9916988.1 (2Fe-2S)-binding protein [Rhodospirillaceae bacterium]MDD9926024.1 (2Fe-2S)-binding protein [Rhodospirillaceae bacterium]